MTHIDGVHKIVYIRYMKKRDLEKKLKALGGVQTHGSKHDLWVIGSEKIAVPRHREINEITAKAILKQAELAKGK